MDEDVRDLNGAADGRKPAADHSSFSTLHSSFVNRWRHRDKLVFRVWPMYKETHRAIVTRKEIPIDGFMATKDGRMVAMYHSKEVRECAFEVKDEDMELMAAASEAGARLRLDEMVVLAPGTEDETTKKECWLEVPFDAYPTAPYRTNSDSMTKNVPTPQLRCVFASDLSDELAKRGYEFDKVEVIESEAEIDEDLICQKAVEENAVIAFTAHGVLGTRARELLRRARYWVVPGRRPEEDGGTFRGYQFCDRFVRWHYRAPESERAARHGEHMEKMHDIVREKGQATRRVYFTDQVVNRFAERIGMSRQRVASRFLDDGVIDWLARSADKVKPKPYREKEAVFCGKITAAVDALEFYYRAIEGRFPTEGRGK